MTVGGHRPLPCARGVSQVHQVFNIFKLQHLKRSWPRQPVGTASLKNEGHGESANRKRRRRRRRALDSHVSVSLLFFERRRLSQRVAQRNHGRRRKGEGSMAS